MDDASDQLELDVLRVGLVAAVELGLRQAITVVQRRQRGRLAFPRTWLHRSSLDAFADLFNRLGPIRGVDYSIANRLGHLIGECGFTGLGMRVHQPAERAGKVGHLLRWSVEEAGPSFVEEGLISAEELERTVARMKRAAEDPDVLALAPRMSLIWGRKRAA